MFFVYNFCPIPLRSGGIKYVSSYLISEVISAVNASLDTQQCVGNRPAACYITVTALHLQTIS